ncbi:MAG: glucose-6-phosphate isomerase, partial [Bacteroidales bacterium]
MQINVSQILNYVSIEELGVYQESLQQHQQTLQEKKSSGNELLGWLDLPAEVSEQEQEAINDDVRRIVPLADVFVVVGIGGSYLGARAVIHALQHSFETMMPHRKPYILYAGNNLSGDYLHDLMELLDHKDYALTVISKSGTTTEPAIAFRLLRDHLEQKYGKTVARKRIITITDKKKGALRELTQQQGYSSYVVPDNVGGRYSVLTAVGLLPVAMAGLDIDALLRGAEDMRKQLLTHQTLEENPAFLYAAARNALYQKNKTTEIMVYYEPALQYFAEWWKQLFGESEGKDQKGIFPASVSFTTDLHSLGQYIQDGKRNLFETVLHVENPHQNIVVPADKKNLDKLNYVAGESLHNINHQAETGTIMAHVDGEVPVIQISIPEINEYHLGELIYFYQYACALSGYLLGVNPFNQPGVEAYKNNMFALLGKPGFEEETEKI